MHAVPIRPGNGVATSPTPVVRIDTATVARRYVELAAALPGVELHYAVKANPAAPVLRTLNREGASWDVASAGEIDAVLAVGGDPDRMSFGNTVKRVADICYAHQLGVRRFSFDAAGELAKLVRFAPKATLMVRIATDGRGAGWALGGKFGCAEPVAADLLARAVAAGHPVGVTFHVGSQQRDPMAWDEPLAATARLRAGLHAGGTDLSVVNVGGGFPAAMLEPVPPIAQYGAAIRRALDEHLGADRPPVSPSPAGSWSPTRVCWRPRCCWSPSVARLAGSTSTRACSPAWSRRSGRPSGTGSTCCATASRSADRTAKWYWPARLATAWTSSTPSTATGCRSTCGRGTGCAGDPPGRTRPPTRRSGSTGSLRCPRSTRDRRTRPDRLPPTFRSAIRSRALRRLLTALLAGSSSQQVLTLAVGVWVLDQTGSGPWVSVAVALTYLPYALLSGVAGVLVDRRSRSTLLAISSLARAACATGLLVAVTVDGPPWVVVSIAAVAAVAATPGYPATAAATVECVPNSALPAANALVTGVENIAWMVGPGVFGLLMLTGHGPPLALAVAAALFGIGTIAAWRVGLPRPARPVDDGRVDGGRMTTVLRLACADPRVRLPLLVGLLDNLLFGYLVVALVLLTASADERLGALTPRSASARWPACWWSTGSPDAGRTG